MLINHSSRFMTLSTRAIAVANGGFHRGWHTGVTARLVPARVPPSPSRTPRRHTAPSLAIARRHAASNEAFGPQDRMAGPSPASLAAAGSGGEGGGGIAGPLFFVSLCAGTAFLGAWQTRRYFEKVDLVRQREEDLGMEPLASYRDWRTLRHNIRTREAGGEAAGDSRRCKSWRRVGLRGTFQHDRSVLVGPRGPPPGALADTGPNSGRGGGGGMSSSAQGYYVITPLVVAEEEEEEEERSSSQNLVREDCPGEASRGAWVSSLWGRRRGATAPPETCGVSDLHLSSDASANRDIVWINRGWIPRTHLDRNDAIATPWFLPGGTVQLTAMESNTETPGAYSPPSRLSPTRREGSANQQTTVNRLLWMDRQAMAEIMDATTSTAAHVHDAEPPLFVEINASETSQSPPVYPVKPTRECVGEFKVMPGTHAGYAFTWFGLSGAGVVMTRKLLRRGR